MKNMKKVLLNLAALAVMAGCNNGIDPINAVAPGTDAAAPSVTFNYPFEGAKIQVLENVVPIDFKFEVSDDIEIKTISLSLDGNKLTEFTSFKDYRRAIKTYTYPTLANGNHTVSITATDLSNKSTTAAVNFQKVAPYTAKYPGEILYFPFDGDYLELLSLQSSTPNGNPVFVNGKVGKAVSLDANNSAYVLFPGDKLATASEFSISFWVNADFVDKNTDNGVDGILGLVNLSNTSNFWGNIDMFVENGSNPSSTKIVSHITNGPDETWFTEVSGVTNFFGQWNHHVLTYDATARQFKYYINSVLKFTKPAGWSGALSFKNSGKIIFGAVHFMTNPSQTSATGSQGWASYLTGEMDEIRIFNRKLTDADVLQIYNDEN